MALFGHYAHQSTQLAPALSVIAAFIEQCSSLTFSLERINVIIHGAKLWWLQIFISQIGTLCICRCVICMNL